MGKKLQKKNMETIEKFVEYLKTKEITGIEREGHGELYIRTQNGWILANDGEIVSFTVHYKI